MAFGWQHILAPDPECLILHFSFCAKKKKKKAFQQIQFEINILLLGVQCILT